MTDFLLEAHNLHKQYGAFKANDNVSLRLVAGKIHALIGENGAGKSTLVNMLYGVTQADTGEIFWRGKRVLIRNPAHAKQIGIGIVFQKFSLFESLTVLENILLGTRHRGKTSDLLNDIHRLNQHYQLAIHPQRRIADLATGERQRVEIIRCLLQKPALLIMDEPTSVLTPAETTGLFQLLKTLAAEGCAILFISHKLDEVESLCDTMTVLRRGKVVNADKRVGEVKRDEMIELMVGKRLSQPVRTPPTGDNATVLRINRMHTEQTTPALQINDLALKAGVVTGIAGIAGNGQEGLQQFISGEIRHDDKNAILLHDMPIGNLGVRARSARGILTVPTDRYHTASVGEMSLSENILLSHIRRSDYIQYGIINKYQLKRFASNLIKKFSISAPAADCPAAALSGGNLQKFVIGRAVLQNPTVLVTANPTWGVDVQAAHFIRQSLRDLCKTGAAVLVVSEDLDELFVVADEIAVLNNGLLSPVVPVTDSLTKHDIGIKFSRAAPTT